MERPEGGIAFVKTNGQCVISKEHLNHVFHTNEL